MPYIPARARFLTKKPNDNDPEEESWFGPIFLAVLVLIVIVKKCFFS